MKAIAAGFVVVILAASLSTPAFAQEPKSAALAKQVAAALDAAKLDSIAVKDPANAGVYVGALYLPGLQIMMVSAKYAAPQLLDTRLIAKEYRDVYADLSGAGDPNSKVFIQDTGIDGLRAKQNGDSFDGLGKRVAFDGDWKKQKLEEAEYLKLYSDADQRYTTMLMLLLEQLKKGS